MIIVLVKQKKIELFCPDQPSKSKKRADQKPSNKSRIKIEGDRSENRCPYLNKGGNGVGGPSANENLIFKIMSH